MFQLGYMNVGTRRHEKGKDNTEQTFVQLKKLGVDSKSLSLRKNLVHMTTTSHKTPTWLSQVENLSAYGDKMILMGYASAS